jgi:apolipoprotein N-acyltransferase
MSVSEAPRRPWAALVASGVATAACYALLFGFEEQVMAAYTRTDGWYPLLPVVTALVFSFVHGAFTGYFWDAVGIRAKPRGPVVEAETD